MIPKWHFGDTVVHKASDKDEESVVQPKPPGDNTALDRAAKTGAAHSASFENASPQGSNFKKNRAEPHKTEEERLVTPQIFAVEAQIRLGNETRNSVDAESLAGDKKVVEDPLTTVSINSGISEQNSDILQRQDTSDKGRGKFRIKNTEPAYKPLQLQRPKPEQTIAENEVRSLAAETSACGLYIHDVAFEKICDHLAWGTHNSRNLVEQGGLLVGDAFSDTDGQIFGVVKDIIPGELARGSAAYLEVTQESWKQMLDKFDSLTEENNAKHILGWYHTHPGKLDVFMSETDRNTQRRFFCMEWQFAIVLNPQRRVWRVFRGEHVNECKGYVIKNFY